MRTRPLDQEPALQDSEPAVPAEIQAIIDRLEAAPETHSHCSHQASFEHLFSIGHYLVVDMIEDDAPGFKALPYSTVEQFLLLIVNGGLSRGAINFAAITRGPEHPPASDLQIDVSELWEIIKGDEAHSLQSSFAVAMGHTPQLRQALYLAVGELLNAAKEIDPWAAEHQEVLAHNIVNSVFKGAMFELAYSHMIAEQREAIEHMQNGPNDEEQPFIPTTARAWPLDGRCRHGHDLEASLYCCDHEKPADIRAHHHELTTDFTLIRRCCKSILEGTRCDVCGELYTWMVGTVDSFDNRLLN